MIQNVIFILSIIKGTFLDNMCKELEFLITIDHNHIVNIFEYYLYTELVYIVMEYLSGGELLNKIRYNLDNLNEGFIKKTMREILGAVSYLHKNQISISKILLLTQSSL